MADLSEMITTTDTTDLPGTPIALSLSRVSEARGLWRITMTLVNGELTKFGGGDRVLPPIVFCTGITEPQTLIAEKLDPTTIAITRADGSSAPLWTTGPHVTGWPRTDPTMHVLL
jgi:hypothetical protein